jgi:chromate reductase
VGGKTGGDHWSLAGHNWRRCRTERAKTVVTVCDMVLMGQPEVYFSYKPELFDEANNISSESTKNFLNSWIDRFWGWIDQTVEPRTLTQADTD